MAKTTKSRKPAKKIARDRANSGSAHEDMCAAPMARNRADKCSVPGCPNERGKYMLKCYQHSTLNEARTSRTCLIRGCPYTAGTGCAGLCERHNKALTFGMNYQAGRLQRPQSDYRDARDKAARRTGLAAHALNGLLSAHEVQNSDEWRLTWYAAVAVRLADALIKELDKGG